MNELINKRNENTRKLRKYYIHPVMIISLVISLLSTFVITFAYIICPIATSLPYYFQKDGESVGVIQVFAIFVGIFIIPLIITLLISNILSIVFMVRCNGIVCIITNVLHSIVFVMLSSLLAILNFSNELTFKPFGTSALDKFYLFMANASLINCLFVCACNLGGLIFLIITLILTAQLKAERKQIKSEIKKMKY